MVFFPETLDQFEDCEWGQWTSWSDPNDKGGEKTAAKEKKRGLNQQENRYDMIYIYRYVIFTYILL